jgi:site-specific recombinase XerD
MRGTGLIVTGHGRELAAAMLPGAAAKKRAAEFFTAEVRNDHTRRAYVNALRRFAAWCEARGLSFETAETVHVATYIKELELAKLSAPTIKQHLAGLRHFFDHQVSGGFLKINPAAAVRGPRHSVKEGKTPILTGGEPRKLLDSIKGEALVEVRDRALIATLLYTAARVNAVINLDVEDYYLQGASRFLRFDEKGGKHHVVPCNHALQELLDAYIERAGLTGQKKAPLFRTIPRGAFGVSANRLTQSNVYELIGRRKKAAGIESIIGCHSMRGTAITNLLENGASVEEAQSLAGHSSIKTTKLYDRRDQTVRRDLVERIRF